MQRLEITNFIELMVVRFVHPRIWAKKKKTNIRHMSLEVKQKNIRLALSFLSTEIYFKNRVKEHLHCLL